MRYIAFSIACMIFVTVVIAYVTLLKKYKTLKSKSAYSKDIARRVIKGQLSEQLFPLLKDCPYLLSDMKFFGMPIDYVVFDGLSDGDIRKVIFIDIKTGNAKLSTNQESIKKAILEKRIDWETWHIDDIGTIKAK